MQEYKVKVYEYQTEWFNLEGKRHRLDGPAVEYSDGGKAYYVYGKLHRIDGPAIEYSDGYKAYFVEGKRMPEYEFNRRGYVKELSVQEISVLLGYEIKVVK